MAKITIDIPEEFVGSGYDEPQYVILVTADRRWNRPEFAALLLKEKSIGEDHEEIGEDTSIKGLLTYAAGIIYRENK